MKHSKYRTIIFDVDSTLSSIEGIEWLASSRGAEVFARVSDATERAMRGELQFDGVYAARLDAVRPTQNEMAGLASAYIENLSPGVKEWIPQLLRDGVRVLIVSGAMRQAVTGLAAHLGVKNTDVHAVPLFFDERGEYAGYDQEHPCSKQLGKRTVISGLQLDPPSSLIGDGTTDAEVKPVVDAFAAYTGAVRRDKIVAMADFEITSFSQVFEHIKA